MQKAARRPQPGLPVQPWKWPRPGGRQVGPSPGSLPCPALPRSAATRSSRGRGLAPPRPHLAASLPPPPAQRDSGGSCSSSLPSTPPRPAPTCTQQLLPLSRIPSPDRGLQGRKAEDSPPMRMRAHCLRAPSLPLAIPVGSEGAAAFRAGKGKRQRMRCSAPPRWRKSPAVCFGFFPLPSQQIVRRDVSRAYATLLPMG